MKPVQIEDRYDITVEADFVARVPMPVVTVIPNNVDLEPFELGYEDTIVFNMTNHGLIRAHNLSLEMPKEHPFLQFEDHPDLGSLEAETSIVVSVKVSRKPGNARTKRWVRVVLFVAKTIYSVREKNNLCL